MASYNAVDNHSQVNLNQQQYGGGAPANPYGSGDPYYSASTGYITPQRGSKAAGGTSKWIKFGIPVAVIVIVAAVVGGILGSRGSSHSSTAAAGSAASGPAAASAAVSAKNAIGRFAATTDYEWMLPVYPSTVRRPRP
jgi:hypothetical protein